MNDETMNSIRFHVEPMKEIYLELLDFNALPAYITAKMADDDKNR